MSSNYLDCKFCMEVTGSYSVAVCGADVQMHIFNSFVSSTKAFVRRAKLVHFQRQKCSSPTPKVLVSNTKCVRSLIQR